MRIILLFLATLLFSSSIYAQSLNPSAFVLGAGNSYSFNEWAATSSAGTYPANMVFGVFRTSPTGDTGALSGPWTCAYNGTARSRIVGGNEKGVVFALTGSGSTGCAFNGYPGAAILALNTLNNNSVNVKFTAGKFSLASGSSTRPATIQLQYRADSSSAFTSVDNASFTWTNGTSTTDSATFNLTLPTSCNNLPYLQLRWVYYQSGGSGNRPFMFLDNIYVVGDTVQCDRPAAPTITVIGGNSPCIGNTVTLTSSSPFRNLWSNGDTNQTITVTTSGTYTVTVSDGTPCRSFASNPESITFASRPGTPTITASGRTSICDGESVTLTSTVGTAYLWNTGDTTRSITVNRAGYYYVIIDNGLNCVSLPSDSILIQVANTARRPLFRTNSVDSLQIRLFATQADTLNENESFFSSSYANVYTSLAAKGLANDIDFGYSFTTQIFGNIYALNDNPSALDTNYIPSRRKTVFATTPSRIPTVINRSNQLDSLWSASTLVPLGDYDSRRIGSRIGTLTNGSKFMFRTVEGRIGLAKVKFILPGATANSYVSLTIVMQPVNKIFLTNASNLCDNDSLILIAPVANGYRWSNGDTSRRTRVRRNSVMTLQTSNSLGCFVPRSDSLEVRIFPSPARPIIRRKGADSLICSDSLASIYVWVKDSTSLVFNTRAVQTIGNGTYRVYVISNTGCTSDTSAPYLYTPTNGKIESSAIKIYPNPSTEKLNIEGVPLHSVWTITDTKGSIIQQGKGQESSLEITGLHSGFYIFQTEGVSKKIIVR